MAPQQLEESKRGIKFKFKWFFGDLLREPICRENV
jgi:hypothetical protein